MIGRAPHPPVVDSVFAGEESITSSVQRLEIQTRVGDAFAVSSETMAREATRSPILRTNGGRLRVLAVEREPVTMSASAP